MKGKAQAERSHTLRLSFFADALNELSIKAT